VNYRQAISLCLTAALKRPKKKVFEKNLFEALSEQADFLPVTLRL
jgi:hypothetical protein